MARGSVNESGIFGLVTTSQPETLEFQLMVT